MSEQHVEIQPERPTIEQEARMLAVQVAANRCEDYTNIITFAAAVEKFLLSGEVDNSYTNSLDS